jgi:hypothetical protein
MWPVAFLLKLRVERGGFILESPFNGMGITMRPIANRVAARLITGACLGVGSLLMSMSAAGAVDGRVRSACTSDYFAFCSQHDPDGAGVRRCMRTNGPKLSSRCLNALVAAGEVSKKEVRRRSASVR